MLIKNGTIIDGSGEKMFSSDIRIGQGTITQIGSLSPKNNEEVLDVSGLYIAPGFIDILNHSDAYITLFENPAQESLLQQGITTILMGNCGSSLAPLVDGAFINSIQKWGDTSKINVNWLSVKEYIRELNKHKFGVNLATLVGHSTVRRALVGDEEKTLTKQEEQQMNYMIESGLREGAFGVSSGLAYSHGKNANAKELRSLMRLVKKYNGLYSFHIRNEAEEFLSSINEIVALEKETKTNIQLSHLKVVEKKFWGQFKDAIDLIEKNKNIDFDVYPYNFTASVAYTFLPHWASKGGNSTLLPAIKDTEKKDKLINDMKGDSYSYADMVVAMGNISNTYFGKKIGDIAKSQNAEAEKVFLDLILASDNRLVVFSPTIDEKNVEMAIKSEKSIISSASAGYNQKHRLNGALVHPRSFGAMPKFLNKYALDEKLLSLEKAIHKITSKPAEKIGLKKRGKIKKGYFADMVIFDPKKIEDKADLNNPYRYPVGISWVLVNGKVAVENGTLKNKNGQILLRK